MALLDTTTCPCVGTLGLFGLGALHHIAMTLTSSLFLPDDLWFQHLPSCLELGRWHLSCFLVLQAAPCLFLGSLPFHWLSLFPRVIQKNLFVILSFLPVTNLCFCSIFHEKV